MVKAIKGEESKKGKGYCMYLVFEVLESRLAVFQLTYN